MMDEKDPMGKADIKANSEEFCDANGDQANCNGMERITICSTTFLMLHKFYRCFYNLFHHYIFISIKYGSLYSAVFVFSLLMQKKWH